MPRTLTIRAIVAVGATAIAGAAQADLCSDLQQQYAAAGSGGSSRVASGGDVAALSRSLNTAQAAADSNNCTGGGFFVFGPRPSPACGAIMAEVNRLQAAIRDSYRGGQVVAYAQYGASRDQIQRQMVASGCPIPGSAYGSSSQQYSAGGYRTLCVRTCDGYYFPLGYGVSSDSFKAAAQTCQSMYGTDNAQLFVMPSDGDVADATPVGGTGKSYGKQPYAFAYRTALNPSCVAQLQSGVATLASTSTTATTTKTLTTTTGTPTTVSATAAPSGPAIPIPQLRRTPFEDPETAANALGRLQATRIEPLIASTVSPTGIRIVGAGYFNQILDQQAAAAPGLVPAPTTVPPPR